MLIYQCLDVTSRHYVGHERHILESEQVEQKSGLIGVDLLADCLVQLHEANLECGTSSFRRRLNFWCTGLCSTWIKWMMKYKIINPQSDELTGLVPTGNKRCSIRIDEILSLATSGAMIHKNKEQIQRLLCQVVLFESFHDLVSVRWKPNSLPQDIPDTTWFYKQKN